MTKQSISHRSGCPIATSLDVIGDKWTLVIIRDMLNGKSRFNQFLDSPERITTTVLTKRLEAMVLHGLAEKRQYQAHPPRHHYVLTEKGVALNKVLLAICDWGNSNYPSTWKAPEGFGSQRPMQSE
jgi:DNA-binding HxlR family transcriptional regulator